MVSIKRIMHRIGVVITTLLMAMPDGQQTSRQTSDVSSVSLTLRNNLTDLREWKTAVYCNNGTFGEKKVTARQFSCICCLFVGYEIGGC